MKRPAPLRRRFGVHARALMTDARWCLLPLASRALWLQLTDLADAMPELRAPSRGHAVTASSLAQYLAAEPLDVTHALAALVQRDILEPVDDGYRLKAF